MSFAINAPHHKAWAVVNPHGKVKAWYQNHKNALEKIGKDDTIEFLPVVENCVAVKLFSDDEGYDWLVAKITSDKYYVAAYSDKPPLDYDMWKPEKVFQFLGEPFSKWLEFLRSGEVFEHPPVPTVVSTSDNKAVIHFNTNKVHFDV